MDALQGSYMSGSDYPPAVVRHALATAKPESYKPAFLALLCDPGIDALDDTTLRKVVQRAGTSDLDLEYSARMAWDSPESIVRIGDAYRQLGLLERWLEVWRRTLHAMAERDAHLSVDCAPDRLASRALRALLSFGAEAVPLLTQWLPLVDCLEREVAWALITFLARIPGEGPGIIACEIDNRADLSPSGNPWIDRLRECANDDVLEYLTRVHVTLPAEACTTADRTPEPPEETPVAGVAQSAE